MTEYIIVNNKKTSKHLFLLVQTYILISATMLHIYKDFVFDIFIIYTRNVKDKLWQPRRTTCASMNL